jgi:hypothetical protein
MRATWPWHCPASIVAGLAQLEPHRIALAATMGTTSAEAVACLAWPIAVSAAALLPAVAAAVVLCLMVLGVAPTPTRVPPYQAAAHVTISRVAVLAFLATTSQTHRSVPLSAGTAPTKPLT